MLHAVLRACPPPVQPQSLLCLVCQTALHPSLAGRLLAAQPRLWRSAHHALAARLQEHVIVIERKCNSDRRTHYVGEQTHIASNLPTSIISCIGEV